MSLVSCAPQAMHLVYKALEGQPLPDVLPVELIPPSKRTAGMAEAAPAKPMMAEPAVVEPAKPAMMEPVKPAMAEPAKPVMAEPVKPAMAEPMMAEQPQPVVAEASSNWVVAPAEKANFDTYFSNADADHDGFVTGMRSSRCCTLCHGPPQAWR